MQKQMLQGSNWKKPEEKIVLSHMDAMQLLKEVAPHVAGHVVGEHPKLERLAKLVGYDLKTVN
jgi:hypothetical protein